MLAIGIVAVLVVGFAAIGAVILGMDYIGRALMRKGYSMGFSVTVLMLYLGFVGACAMGVTYLIVKGLGIE